MAARTVVLIPTYNEAESIEGVVHDVLAAVACDVIVLDDNSPDGTGVIVDALARREPRVSVVHRTSKDGLAAAYRHGFTEALRRGYECIVQMDGDGSHDISALQPMVDAIGDYDLAVGSRYTRGGGVENWSWHRRAISRLGSLYASSVLNLPVKDATSGMKAWRATFLSTMVSSTVGGNGYVFQVEMTHRAAQLGARVTEVPITFVERKFGESKFSSRMILEAAFRVALLRMREVRERALARI
jgi:dolichol-phosphate mannosyltransferase